MHAALSSAEFVQMSKMKILAGVPLDQMVFEIFLAKIISLNLKFGQRFPSTKWFLLFSEQIRTVNVKIFYWDTVTVIIAG